MARKPTNYINEYRKLRRNILQRIRRAEKRGYVFDTTAIPEIKKDFVSFADIKKLRKETVEKTYAKAISNPFGVDAKQARAIERSQSAKKGWQTRTEKKRARERREDERRRSIETDTDYAPNYTDIVFDNVFEQIERVFNTEIISDVRTEIRSGNAEIQSKHTADLIGKRSNKAANTMIAALADRISQVGEEELARIIDEDSETIFDAIHQVFASLNLATEEYELHLAVFTTALLGRPMTQEEAKTMEEADTDIDEEMVDIWGSLDDLMR